MSVELKEALVWKLKGLSGLPAGTRVYPMGETPQAGAVTPRLTFVRLANRHMRHLSGTSHRACARYQINCYGASNLEADTLADTVRAGFEGYRGDMGAGTSPLRVNGCFVQDDYDDFIQPPDASEDGIFFVPLAVTVWHVE